ncbi:hypothetical protein FRC09_014604 [Ceratobasidium sp. 395]|nr:hypothetical protein FRC09_014604 [Ceratobasidium sp. 395]
MEEARQPVPPQSFSPNLPVPLQNFDAKQPNPSDVRGPETQTIEFGKLWRVRKEAHWELIAPPKNGTRSYILCPTARSPPTIWSENLYDAQDALPYFSVGQTILTSKVPRVQARSVLLTKNLHNIEADWRRGNIKFSIHLKYKLELARPRNWQAPATTPEFEIINTSRNPPDPLQFRKLIACRDSGVPVKLLATGDFPSLPVVNAEIELDNQTSVTIKNNSWRNGLVVLGFFWVKRVEENLEKHKHKGNFDLETGRTSGEAHWDFEFETCDQDVPSWWCPLGDDSECEDDTEYNEELISLAKRPRLDCDERLLGEEMELDDFDEMDSRMYELPEPELQCQSAPHWHTPPPSDPCFHQDLGVAEQPVAPSPKAGSTNFRALPPGVEPSALKLTLEPKEWPDVKSIRPPQIRASLLSGWHCKACGKLNPHVKWTKAQECPFCKTKTEIAFPEWHRKAHTETNGPIGTFYRLDDGGHSHKVGLHALAAQDPENGMTCVEYWLADPPLPILAEIGRVKPTRRGAPPRLTPRQNEQSTSSVNPSPIGGTALLPAIPRYSTTLRDPGGSRAVLAKDSRMLFVHVTCPQHPNLLALPDRIFSEFASKVPMERQINTKEYKTGLSSLSCHYTYLAGVGTSVLHRSGPAVGWEDVPDCVYNAHKMLVDMQCYSVDEGDYEQNQLNQSVFIVGSGCNGVNSFKMVHRAEDGPVGYMVLGAGCEVQLMVGDGQSKRTTKAGAQRRAEMLMAHGDALFITAPKKGDLPIEVRVKRTGLAVVLVARYFESGLAESSVAPELNQEAEASVSAMEGIIYNNTGHGDLKPSSPAIKTQAKKRKSRS